MSLHFVDAASGVRGGDSFAAAKASQSGDLSVVEAIRVWAPPFSPAAVVAECAAWVRSAGEYEVHGDRWSGELVREMFLVQGVSYTPCELDKGQLYLAFLPLINSGRVKLLDHAELLRQLRGLERRRGWGGRDRVDHRRGQHDDIANAVAGAVVLCAQGATNGGMWFQRPTGPPVPVAPVAAPTPAMMQAAREKRERADAVELAKAQELEQKDRDKMMGDGPWWSRWGG